MAVHLESHVDRVAGRSRHRAGDHPLLLSQAVHERALSHVPPPDHRQLHLREFCRGLLDAGGRLGQTGENRLDKCLTVAVLPGAHDQRLAETERGKLVGMVVEFGIVGLVGNEQHGHADAANAGGNLVVVRHQTTADIDDEQDDRGLAQACLDLGIDAGGEAVGIIEAHAAGVDEIDRPALQREPLHESIPRHARCRVLDRDPLLDEPVEEGRLADIRPANDRDLGDQRYISGWWCSARSRPIGGRDQHARPPQLTLANEIWWLAPF